MARKLSGFLETLGVPGNSQGSSDTKTRVHLKKTGKLLGLGLLSVGKAGSVPAGPCCLSPSTAHNAASALM